MRAKTVLEDYQQPFSNNLRNGANLGIKVYPAGQYESADKKKKKRKKKVVEGRDQNFRTPFATHSAMRNNQFNADYPLSKIQYEDADKPEEDDETLDEKFLETSDPLGDMGIGGFVPNDIYHEFRDEAAQKWIDLLKNSFEGKIVKGTMMKWGGRHDWNEYSIKVKKVLNTLKRDGFSHEIHLQDENDNNYTVLGEDKMYVLG